MADNVHAAVRLPDRGSQFQRNTQQSGQVDAIDDVVSHDDDRFAPVFLQQPVEHRRDPGCDVAVRLTFQIAMFGGVFAKISIRLGKIPLDRTPVHPFPAAHITFVDVPSRLHRQLVRLGNSRRRFLCPQHGAGKDL